MTSAEQLAWINANMSGSPKISPEVMRNYFFMLRDNFAHIDSPLQNYPDQIADTDLDGNLQVTITHNLGTTVPELMMYDENDNIIYDEYFNTQVIDGNSVLLTFNDNIPATGNGYYSLVVYFVIDAVPARYNEVFSSAFDAWTAGEPDDFTVTTPPFSNPTIENDANRAKLTADGWRKITISPDVVLTENRNYRVTVKLDVGNLVVTSGTQQQSITSTGTHSFIIMAGATSLIIKQGSANIATIDTLLIEEEL